MHFNIIHPPKSWSSYWSHSFWLFHQYPICIALLPPSCCMPCLSHPPWLDHSNYSTSYEVPHYAVLSNLLSLHLSSVQIFSSAPCSQTPSAYVPPLLLETKFHTRTEPREKIIFFYIPCFNVLRQQTRRQNFWTEW
jgi:hypothetical protein